MSHFWGMLGFFSDLGVTGTAPININLESCHHDLLRWRNVEYHPLLRSQGRSNGMMACFRSDMYDLVRVIKDTGCTFVHVWITPSSPEDS